MLNVNFFTFRYSTISADYFCKLSSLSARVTGNKNNLTFKKLVILEKTAHKSYAYIELTFEVEHYKANNMNSNQLQ